MKRSLLWYLCILLIAAAPVILSAQTISGTDVVVQLPRSKGTVYRLFDLIAERTGKTFVYDSNLIHSDRSASIRKGSYTLQQAVRIISGDPRLEVRVIGSHILLLLPPEPKKPVAVRRAPVVPPPVILTGIVVDKSTRLPLEASSVRVEGTSIGCVSNGNGEFRLVIPDSLSEASLLFSRLGYNLRRIRADLLGDRHTLIALEEKSIPLQEVVLRLVNPMVLLQEMERTRAANYPADPSYATAFYREGVEYKDHLAKLSEGVFKIYKPTAFRHNADEVELLKMRNISRVGETDSVLARLKAGIDAALQLDLVKNRPDFLTLTNNNYRYLSTGMTSIDERTAYIVYFEQKEEVQQPLFRGELYIDTQTYALLGADFEVNPHYVKKASDLFVEKKDRKLAVTPHKITYSVRYKQWGSHYYMDYVRGDLTFRVHRRHRLWSNARLHMWFEMATCKIDTVQVRPFPKSQRLPRRVIFQDVDFPFNDTFWDNFNVIPPETKLSDAIRGMAVKIEEVLRQTEK